MAKKTKKAAAETKSTARLADYALLLTPMLTEKSSRIGNQGAGIVFKVRRDADKTEIKQAIERVFNVQVAAVRTCNYQGKPKRTMRSQGRRASYKKAYITLKEGQTIDIVEGL